MITEMKTYKNFKEYVAQIYILFYFAIFLINNMYEFGLTKM